MDGYVTIGTELDTKSFDAQIKDLEDKLDYLEKYANSKDLAPKEGTTEYKELQAEIEKTRNKLVDLRKKQEDLVKKTPSMLENIGNSMNSIIKKVTRWGFAVFGIRSVFSAISSAVSTLSQYDDKMATDIEYIRWVLAMSIKPIIEWIIKAVYTIIQLVGSLINSIFDINIFANASADAFKKAKNNIGGANKEAKQLQKTLAGFDEMNVLQADGSVSAGGGGGGYTPPDLSNIASNSVIEKLKNFWEKIFNFWEKDWKNIFNNIGGKWGSFIQGLILIGKGFWDTIKGIGQSIKGTIQIIVGLITGNFDLVKEGFDNLIKGMKNILMGAIERVTGVLLAVFGFVKGVFLEIWDVFYTYLIKPVLDFFDGIAKTVNEALTKVFEEASKIFSPLINILVEPFQRIVDFVKDLWNKVKKPIGDFVDKVNNKLKEISPFKIGTGIAGTGLFGKFKNLFGFSKGGIVVPKLASGGIINQPGRGVPLTSAIGGERGAEGVIPLTDSQQMQLLGEAIGRYITVNAQMNNYMNGRLISRELQRVQNDSDFAYNR